MNRLLLSTLLLAAVQAVNAAPTVFPTGTTIYDPGKAWNGYTLFSILDDRGAVLVDMNGRVVKRWNGFNLSASGPARILPGGIIIGTAGSYSGHQEATALVEMDFNGNELSRFARNEQISGTDGVREWSARQHHDWQRENFPAGYYSPEYFPGATGSKTLLLTHTNHRVPAVADVLLEDDRIIEVAPDGEILWDWRAADHIDEFGFDEAERQAIRTAAGSAGPRGVSERYDWLHINSATYVGPNQWYDAGDQRFAPANVIISSRQASIIAIVARDGSIAWQIGPNFSRSEAEQAIRQVIGQHHAHFIPVGLPGAGNVLIFDNGGSSGYGPASPIAPNGLGVYARATSRVLEINPVTLELVWTYVGRNFFSTNISGAQRLPNSNTLITEGATGRVFEVTNDREIVWEYMVAPSDSGRRTNAVYRAHRIPYAWVPQLQQPEEIAVPLPDLGQFVIPY